MRIFTVDPEISVELYTQQQARELFWMVDSNRRHLREWLPWIDNVDSPASMEFLIPQWTRQFQENNGFCAGIRYHSRLAGTISLNQIDWVNSQTSVGYYLFQQAQGRGIMTRTVSALLTNVFNHLGLNRVEIRCGEGNRKSQAIPEKLGFKKEGLIRDGEFLHNTYHNLIIYGMLKREWRQSTPIFNNS